jgi:uncharacterized protein
VNKDLIGKGWPFPVKPGPAGRMFFLGGPEKIRESIWLILSTAPGQRVMMPDFGCGIHELLFQPNSAALHGLIVGKVHDALTRWEPRIDVLDVNVVTPSDPRNVLLLRIAYRIRSTNACYNLVYPLYINEGPG